MRHEWRPHDITGVRHAFVKGELAAAAAYYAAPTMGDTELYFCTELRVQGGIEVTGETTLFPWDQQWDKKAEKTRVRQLEVAAALIIAEIERLRRSEDG